MKIYKETQIKQLTSELENLGAEYERLRNSSIKIVTSNLLEKAEEELAVYLERERLAIEEKPDFSASAYEMIASTEYLNVRVTRYPNALRVQM